MTATQPPTDEQHAAIRAEILAALSAAGAFCGECGFEPGEIGCSDCVRVREMYADALTPITDRLRAENGRLAAARTFWEGRYREESRTVWDGGLPPGGEACADCGQPVESEPCPEHHPATVAERLLAELAAADDEMTAVMAHNDQTCEAVAERDRLRAELEQARAATEAAREDVKRIRAREAEVRTARREALRERDEARADLSSIESLAERANRKGYDLDAEEILAAARSTWES